MVNIYKLSDSSFYLSQKIPTLTTLLYQNTIHFLMEVPKKCPKCSSDMEQGQLLDNDYMTTVSQSWAKHATSFLGLGVKEARVIVSFRCKSCGFLENYAP
jgi:hypothetical protein